MYIENSHSELNTVNCMVWFGMVGRDAFIALHRKQSSFCAFVRIVHALLMCSCMYVHMFDGSLYTQYSHNQNFATVLG